MSGVVLAIACLEGVALWHVYRDHKPNGVEATWTVANPAKDRPSELLSETFNRPSRAINKGGDTAWLGLARMAGLKGVDQISWDPRGELLAIGSEHSSTVFIRENATTKVTELRLNKLPTPPRIVRSVENLEETGSNIKAAFESATGAHTHSMSKPSHKTGHYGPTVCCLNWSPSGERLLVGYRSGQARIYETATWEYVALKNMKGILKTASWTPDGFNLIFTLEGDDQIRAIHFEKRSGDLTWIPLNPIKVTLQSRDIEALQRTLEQKGLAGRSLQELENFGPVEELALDQNGERLVVRFRDTDLLGVVLVRPTGSMLRDLDIFMPMGFIQGPGWSGKEVVSPPSADDDDDDEDDTTGREPKATTMAFTSHFKGGSMLSIVSFEKSLSEV